ncbi:hypothetical protein PR202_gb12276 [Eleusine coracana subsp. coracana]|uniref:Fanconi anemia group D2 protein n=1 Tax=Eleusine coracana subsp. coracana TaxID=191504 RepID=A0AAV5EQ29_ELECO|nr:hypothetical protein PR202_gb12276 [Eleusine coracana subsp. coracana]
MWALARPCGRRAPPANLAPPVMPLSTPSPMDTASSKILSCLDAATPGQSSSPLAAGSDRRRDGVPEAERPSQPPQAPAAASLFSSSAPPAPGREARPRPLRLRRRGRSGGAPRRRGMHSPRAAAPGPRSPLPALLLRPPRALACRGPRRRAPRPPPRGPRRLRGRLPRAAPPAPPPHCPARTEPRARALLSVPALQPGLLAFLLEKLPEHFDGAALDGLPLQDDVGRLIVAQFGWLDFLVDADTFVENLVEVLSVAPPRLKKEIIGSLPEIVGDQSHATVVSALEKLLQEDSEVVVAVLDALSDLNLNEMLQEQAVTVAISCIRTIAADQMPHLLRFLLLAAIPDNVGRITSQIREQLKFISVIDPRAARSKKLKGKASTSSTDRAMLDTLRSGLRFKNILSEAFLKELKSVGHQKDHKVIDVWLIMLIYANGGAFQKSAEKLLKSKILQGCMRETLFDQCIHGNTELVKEHFMSYLSVSDYLLACKEERAREFATYLFTALFEEFSDTYSRQELVGSLITHIGSGVSYEVSSALDIMISLASNNPEELIPISSYITGILDYLESFNDENLRKVYDIFCHLALAAGFNAGSGGSKVANELLMVVRKQVNNPDMKYRRMGIIGALRIVSTIADVNAEVNCSSSQQPNCEEALELLKMAVDSCKFVTLPLILLYDELATLLETKVLHSAIIEWVGQHATEFDTHFLADLDDGQLPEKYLCDGIEGELWMNLDGDISPVCVNIVPLVSTSPQKSQPCLQILHSQFSLLTMVNAFSTQVANRVDNISQKARDETAVKLLQRLRNLLLLEGLMNAILKSYPVSLPELRYLGDYSGSTSTSKFSLSKKMVEESTEGAPLKKRQKGRRDKTTLENLDSSGKLKQPTILDAFKRAGVTVSQETNKASSQPLPSVAMPKDIEQEVNDPGELGVIDLMAAPTQLDMQRFKFRNLRITCLSLLNYSETQDSACYLESELPVFIYLLRDLHDKLDHLIPSSKPFLSTYQARYTQAHCHKSTQDFVDKVQALFFSLRKHLDGAISMIKDVLVSNTSSYYYFLGSESCRDNWSSYSSSAGNPDIPYMVVPRSSIASSVCKEVLACYRKLLAIPHLLNQSNLSVLKQLLQTLQPAENFDDILSEFHPSLASSNFDYLYCGTYKMLEDIIDPASDVLITMQSILSSVIALLEKSGEANGKNMHMGCSKDIIPFLRKRIGASAHKLLTFDLPSEDAEKGDIIQKILQIYLKNSDSTSDPLDELACLVLPKHEENTESLNKTIKQALRTRALPENGSVETILGEINKSVKVFVSLINLCKTHEKVSMHAMAVKHGGKFVDTFLKAFNFLETQFGQHNDIIIQTSLTNYADTAQRTSESDENNPDYMFRGQGQYPGLVQGYKRTMITSKVPATKRSMERFLFQVKALLHNCSSEDTFWLGNLKHKDLHGHVVSSQVYGGVDDSSEEDQEQMETDPDPPADENGDNMEEGVAEESSEATREEE